MIDPTAFRATADGSYWQALEQGRLTMQQCSCGAWHWPAVWRCADCGTWDPEWKDIAIEGALFSWQTSWYRFGGTEGMEHPYTSMLVEMDGTDGRRLLGLLDGADEGGLSVGVRVKGRIATVEVGRDTVPVIRWWVA